MYLSVLTDDNTLKTSVKSPTNYTLHFSKGNNVFQNIDILNIYNFSKKKTN